MPHVGGVPPGASRREAGTGHDTKRIRKELWMETWSMAVQIFMVGFSSVFALLALLVVSLTGVNRILAWLHRPAVKRD